jgi:hypothetical protein
MLKLPIKFTTYPPDLMGMIKDPVILPAAEGKSLKLLSLLTSLLQAFDLALLTDCAVAKMTS